MDRPVEFVAAKQIRAEANRICTLLKGLQHDFSRPFTGGKQISDLCKFLELRDSEIRQLIETLEAYSTDPVDQWTEKLVRISQTLVDAAAILGQRLVRLGNAHQGVPEVGLMTDAVSALEQLVGEADRVLAASADDLVTAASSDLSMDQTASQDGLAEQYGVPVAHTASATDPPSLGFLHLSDLHFGTSQMEWLWPTMEQDFLADLTSVANFCGKIDLVLFTGDLTFCGDFAQFNAVSELLTKLVKELRRLGSDPRVLAVPGNHDLRRPPWETYESDIEILQKMHSLKTASKRFWEDDTCPLRQLVAEAFGPYIDWWEHHRPHRPDGEVPGELPGDFAVTIPLSNGHRVGVMGLNTAFRQLADGNYRGRVSVHAQQFHKLGGVDWLDQSEVCLLLTHHPANWFDKEAQGFFDEIIYRPMHFAAHLHGHLHEPDLRNIGRMGSDPRCFFQSTALFGRNEYSASSRRRKPGRRVHGYSAGRLTFAGEASHLRFWPRMLREDGRWIYPDHANFQLQHSDHGTMNPIQVKLRAQSGNY